MKNQKNKGITLIALVITIVVLVILVGVSVSTAINTGLISNSKTAVEDYDKAQKNELAFLEKAELIMSGKNYVEGNSDNLIFDTEYEIIAGFKSTPPEGTILEIPAFIDGVAVTKISEAAFPDQANLAGVIIPEGVTEIDNDAFIHCTNLEIVKIPKSVERIGRGAFQHCTSLTNITIPSSVTSIGNDAFGECTNLTNVTIEKGSTLTTESDFYPWGIDNTDIITFEQ